MAEPGKIALTIALAAFLISAAAAQTFYSPSGRFVLPAPLGNKLLHQCSRDAPIGATEFWQPSPKEVDELEASLPKYLEKRHKAGKMVPAAGLYHRQYVGFVAGAQSAHPGERFIYANFYPGSEIPATFDESAQPMLICDGGSAFWGIVYRVSTKSFEAPKFNGVG